MKVFDAILQNGESEQDALDYARGMAWGEVETTEQKAYHSDHVQTIDGVGVWYNYGADYYFFTDEIS